jgi:hypothetical protein
MAGDLAAIREAWESRDAAGPRSSSSDGRAAAAKDANVFKMADQYVKANPKEFAGLENLSLDVLVKLIEDAREKGDADAETRLQVWEWHHFERQNIGGTYQATVRQV